MNILPFVSNADRRKHLQNISLLANPPWAFRSSADFFLFHRNIFNGSESCSVHRGTGDQPPWAVVSDAETCLVICGGVQSLAQAWVYAESCIFAEKQNFQTGMLSCFAVSANAIALQTGFRSGTDKRRVFIGHSFGGGVCSYLYTYAGDGNVTGPMEAWTYGAPRSVLRASANYFDERYVRTVLIGDPVCRVFPHFGDGGLGDRNVMTIPQQALCVNHVVQPRACVTITTSGEWGASENPPWSFTENVLPAGDFLYSPAAFLNATHNVVAYVAAINAAVPQESPDEVAIAQRIPAVEVQSEVNLRREYERALRAAVVASAVPEREAVRAVQANTTEIAGLKYRRKTFKGIRMVTYDGHVVWMCNSRKEQKRVCAELNRQLRT